MGHRDELTSLLGLLEGRYAPHLGRIRKSDSLSFLQSDEQLFGGKVIDQPVEQYWALGTPKFHLEGRRREKLFFIDSLRAYHLRHLTAYRLRGEERRKFALLSLLFQEKGMILVHRLLLEEFSEPEWKLFQTLHAHSTALICYFTVGDEGAPTLDQLALERPMREIRFPRKT